MQRDVEAGSGDAEDRVVPEVEAVRAHADPAQRPRSRGSGPRRSADARPTRSRAASRCRRAGSRRGTRSGRRSGGIGNVKCAERPEQHEHAERRPTTSSATRTPRPGRPRIWYGAKKNAIAEPSSRPDKRVVVRVVRGVDAAAHDDRHQHARRERDADHRPEHALAGRACAVRGSAAAATAGRTALRSRATTDA